MKEEIINNHFVDKIRQKMEIDEEEYLRLCDALIRLRNEQKNKDYIDKELVSYLYAIPLVVRNEFLSLKEISQNNTFCNRLEDIWIELDELVTNCFQ